MFSAEQSILIALALPLVAYVSNSIFGNKPNWREGGTVVIATVLFAVVAMMAKEVMGGARPSWTAFEILPGFAISFSVEPLGMLFALVASGLWILTTIYGAGYMRAHHEPNQTRFFGCFAIAIFAALAAAFSANLFTLFVAYELMTVSTYPLVTHNGNAEAKAGGRVYLGILLSTSIAFFMLAIAWTWHICGTLDFTPGGILSVPVSDGRISTWQLALLLGLFVYGIGKAALMPVHRWLPAAMVAPTPVSALLHAVAVVKVGVFSVLKIAVYIFGIDLLADTGANVWLVYAAGFTIVVASLVAMTKDNLKARLAYSTIGQLAYITLGAALATPAAAIGGGMHIAMHAVGKITLFFCAGAIYVAAHKKNISEMRGLGRQMPWTFGAFLVASVSIIGLPPGGGAWSKWFLAVGTVEGSYYWLTAALMVSSLLNIAYLVPIPILAFMKPHKDDGGEHQEGVDHSHSDHGEAPLACVIPLVITATMSIGLFFFADSIYESLRPMTEEKGTTSQMDPIESSTLLGMDTHQRRSLNDE